VALSCKKSNPGDCFNSTGAIITESRYVEAFLYLSMENNVDVFLTYSPTYTVQVKAGENIISGIITTVQNKTLSIKNENTCNWIRSYEKPLEVYIGTPKLDSIVYSASGNLTSTNSFIGDSIKLDVLEGAGSINLWVDMKRSSTYNLHYGTADLQVKGYSHISYVYSGGYGPADLRNLNTTYSYLTNNSTNNCYVFSILELEVKIENVGDVYYFGNPTSVSLQGGGTGMLYKQ
jgi:hypothetical protein